MYIRILSVVSNRRWTINDILGIYTNLCKSKKGIPPTDGRRLRDFYHNWTNSILQQLKRNFWKIADALFRIS